MWAEVDTFVQDGTGDRDPNVKLIPESAFLVFFFFFQAEDGIRDYKVTGVQTCALPICHGLRIGRSRGRRLEVVGQPFALGRHVRIVCAERVDLGEALAPRRRQLGQGGDRKSTRLNSSHLVISYAVFCLKKKKQSKRLQS